MIIKKSDLEDRDLGGGIIMQPMGDGQNLNAFHWDLADGAVIPWHSHPNEQFGYIIKGGFDIKINDTEYQLGPGDSYYIPPDAMHTFVAIGQTEAIDVFSPRRDKIPDKIECEDTKK